jgi:hypothetical protein
VHSLVLELTGKKEPQDGLQGKFSVYHGFAAGPDLRPRERAEYEDDIVTREDMDGAAPQGRGHGGQLASTRPAPT